MFSPSKVKHRKIQKGRMRGRAARGDRVTFGEYGLKTVEPAWITARQIEAARVAVMRFVGKNARMWIRIFPDKPITRKPAETRMGKGKGAPEYWVAPVHPGRVLFELAGDSRDHAKEALRRGAQKLPCKTCFVVAED